MADELEIPMPSMMPAAGGPAWRNARRREPMDGATKRLALFAGVIGGGLLMMVGAWSLSGHRAGSSVPVIEADVRPLRTKPENRGGLQVAGQDDAILSGNSGGPDAMAPPPEAPAPQALRETASPTPAAPKPVAPSAPAPSVVQAPPAPAATPVPALKPASAGVAAAKPAAAAHALGGPQVQLAALVSEEAANTEWQRLLHKMPDLLGGRTAAITRLERTDGKVFWRLRTSGFADISQATSFCEKMRAKGTGCSLATF